jgi:hypothetical protein
MRSFVEFSASPSAAKTYGMADVEKAATPSDTMK